MQVVEKKGGYWQINVSKWAKMLLSDCVNAKVLFIQTYLFLCLYIWEKNNLLSSCLIIVHT